MQEEMCVSEKMVKAAVENGVVSFEGLARALGYEPNPEFESEVKATAPEVEYVIQANREYGLGVEAMRAGDWDAVREHKRLQMAATVACMDMGVSFRKYKIKKGDGDMIESDNAKSAEEGVRSLLEIEADVKRAEEALGDALPGTDEYQHHEAALADAMARLTEARLSVPTVDAKPAVKLSAKEKPAMKLTAKEKPAMKLTAKVEDKPAKKLPAKKPEGHAFSVQDLAMVVVDPKFWRTVTIDGDVVQKNVIGLEKGEYCGRQVVVVGNDPMFGCPPARGASRCTVHNGIVNHCDIGTKAPQASWACVDAASNLKSGFTKEQLMDLAVETLVKFGGVEQKDVDKARVVCSNVFDDMKRHQRHVRRKFTGWSFIIDSGEGRTMSVRARHFDETLQYFEKAEERAADKTLVRSAKKVKVPRPTEKRPISVIVGSVR